MKAAIVKELGHTPVYGDFSDPAIGAGEVGVAVIAAALSPLVKSRASGSHYSDAAKVPFIAGVDGVGTLADGRRVYFMLPKAPFGSMAQRVAIRPEQCIPLPDELDDTAAAAIANPGMSCWAALKERARFKAGETVLINGATGTAGRLAVQVAKYMGAKRIVATGRNKGALQELISMGANDIIALSEEPDGDQAGFEKQFAQGIDVVLDYLWGPSAERLLSAAAKGAADAIPIRFVQIGSVSGTDIRLPSSVLRSSALQLMGSGLGSVPRDRLIQAITEVFAATVPGGFEINTREIPLSEVEQGWKEDTKERIVFKV